jgi:integrase
LTPTTRRYPISPNQTVIWAYTGARLSEVGNLDLDDVDLTTDSVYYHGKGARDRRVRFVRAAETAVTKGNGRRALAELPGRHKAHGLAYQTNEDGQRGGGSSSSITVAKRWASAHSSMVDSFSSPLATPTDTLALSATSRM